jgi:molecular chaperone GrpE (heat shock protein)
VVRTALLTLLDEQGVSPMPVAAGDRFDGERHSNQETVSDVDLPAGAVVEVLAKGYLRRAGKTTVVLRPAMVRVNAAKVK